MKRTGYRLAAAVALASGLIASPAGAVVTSKWVVESYENFDEGEAKASFITSIGEVRPGWDTSRVDIEQGGVWSAARGPDGAVYVGTDDSGAIYSIRGDKVAKLTSIPDVLAVVSLALGPDGTLYAGTMPGAQVWTVDPKSGKTGKLADLEGAETIWALTMSRDGKTVYAGTGPKGELFAVDRASGKAKLALETDDKRILSLTTTSDGAVWVGTSDRALVFRYDPATGRARAMADFAGNEITAMAEFKGGVVVTANDLKEPTTNGVKSAEAIDKALKEPKEGEKPDLPKEGSTPGADKKTPSGAEVQRKGGRKGSGALYRVHGDGRLEQLHALTATYFTAVAVTEDGRVFGGAGDKGRIYMIDTDDSVSTAFDVEERLIAAILYDATGLSFLTADASAYYRARGKASKAEYLSDVHDTEAPSRFGKIVWHGDGKLTVETRTGNTAKPGTGWSRWAKPVGVQRGGGESMSGRVASPTGRYIQYRVSFGGDTDAVLRKTAVYFLPQNEPTRIESVELDHAAKSRGVTLQDGASKPRSPVIKIEWKVDNPDKDTTHYELQVRREGEVLWRPIPTGKRFFTGTSFEWNTETFPDGYYRIRVSASDERSNASARALVSHKTTGLFLVDNEKPRLEGINVRYPNASARASDAMSAISEMAYSIDGEAWMVGATDDGIFDELTEVLRIGLPKDLAPGVHTLAIRVADEAGNIGSTQVTFRVK